MNPIQSDTLIYLRCDFVIKMKKRIDFVAPNGQCDQFVAVFKQLV